MITKCAFSKILLAILSLEYVRDGNWAGFFITFEVPVRLREVSACTKFSAY